MKRSLFLVLPLLAACAQPLIPRDPVETAALPRDAVVGAGDPTRSAILSTAAVFGHRNPAAGRPAEAARGIAQMEFLAVTLPSDANLANSQPTLQPQLATARREWRAALDIAPDAPAQPVIDSLYAAGRALDAGQGAAAAAALPPTIFRRGGGATVAQLAALPPLPATAAAAATGQQALRTLTPTRVF